VAYKNTFVTIVHFVIKTPNLMSVPNTTLDTDLL